MELSAFKSQWKVALTADPRHTGIKLSLFSLADISSTVLILFIILCSVSSDESGFLLRTSSMTSNCMHGNVKMSIFSDVWKRTFQSIAERNQSRAFAPDCQYGQLIQEVAVFATLQRADKSVSRIGQWNMVLCDIAAFFLPLTQILGAVGIRANGSYTWLVLNKTILFNSTGPPTTKPRLALALWLHAAKQERTFSRYQFVMNGLMLFSIEQSELPWILFTLLHWVSHEPAPS